MKTIFYSLILAVLLTATSSLGQVENLLGVYFDQEGTNTCLEEFPPAYEMYNIYVVLQNPSMPTIQGFGYLIEGMDYLFFISSQFCAPGLSICDFENHVCLTMNEPYLLDSTNVLVTYTLMSVPNTPESACFTMVGSFSCPDQSQPTLYLDLDGNTLHPNLEPGPGNGCMASLGTCVVSTEPQTWNTLKALYR